MSERPGGGSAPQVTELLLAWSRGDDGALKELTPFVYRELHQIARRYMLREHAGHTLQPTALVNEAYMRLVDVKRMHWQNRAHFLAMSATLMRRILVDFARTRRAHRRGGDAQLVTFDEALMGPETPGDLVALDDALEALATIDARRARVVELRFFGGLSVEETAEVLKVAPGTVMRDWKFAKAWLFRQLKPLKRQSDPS